MLDEAARETASPAAGSAQPVGFAGCVGFLHGAAGRVGVLMVSPWGFEELTIRKSWRILAEQLAAAGYPALRFDLPGTGNSAGAQTDVTTLDAWRAAIDAGAEVLRKARGCERIVLLGQGLGALLALEAAARLPGTAAAVALAPSAPGRMGMRELELWGAMLAAAHNIPAGKGEGEALCVAGFALSAGLAEDLRRLDPRKLALPAGLPVLLLARAERPADSDLAQALAAAGAAVETRSFEGYAALVSDPTASRTPEQDYATVLNWLRHAAAPAATAVALSNTPPAEVSGEGYRERTVSFGPHARLFGVLTLPDGAPRGSVVFLNAGYNPQAGWARMGTDQARQLAQKGYASLRFDTADIGDSPAVPGGPAIVLYDDAQVQDVAHALDLLAAHDLPRPVLVGRCSGAFLALHAADRDARVGGVVAVNPLRLVWVPTERVADAIQHSYRSLENYGSRLLQAQTWRQILRGEIDLRRVSGNVLARLARRAAVKLAPFTGGLTQQGRLLARVRGMFDGYRARGVPVALVYAEGDGGLDELRLYFGTQGRALAGYPNVVQHRVAGADHNMTPHHARAAVLAAIIATLERLPVI